MGLTQQQLVEMTKLPGSPTFRLSRRELIRIERGGDTLLSTAHIISNALGLPLEFLLGSEPTLVLTELRVPEGNRIQQEIVTELMELAQVLFVWVSDGEVERDRRGARVYAMIQCPDLRTLRFFLNRRVLSRWGIGVRKTQTRIAFDCYKFSLNDRTHGRQLGLIMCSISEAARQNEIARQISNFEGVIESRGLLGSDDMFMVWRGDDLTEFQQVVKKVNGIHDVSVTVSLTAETTAKNWKKFGNRLVDTPRYQSFRGVLANNNGNDVSYRRVKITDLDGSPLPWDLVVRGKFAEELNGLTLVLRLCSEERGVGGLKPVGGRGEPWD
jgi:transcriptional regulator with XRE-family HTH domain